jgi:hypothetical protein
MECRLGWITPTRYLQVDLGGPTTTELIVGGAEGGGKGAGAEVVGAGRVGGCSTRCQHLSGLVRRLHNGTSPFLAISL